MEGDDKSKYEYVDKLRSIQLSFRISNRLCIFCGQVGAVTLACPECAEERRKKRIAECGYDYLEDSPDRK